MTEARWNYESNQNSLVRCVIVSFSLSFRSSRAYATTCCVIFCQHKNFNIRNMSTKTFLGLRIYRSAPAPICIFLPSPSREWWMDYLIEFLSRLRRGQRQINCHHLIITMIHDRSDNARTRHKPSSPKTKKYNFKITLTPSHFVMMIDKMITRVTIICKFSHFLCLHHAKTTREWERYNTAANTRKRFI